MYFRIKHFMHLLFSTLAVFSDFQHNPVKVRPLYVICLDHLCYFMVLLLQYVNRKRKYNIRKRYEFKIKLVNINLQVFLSKCLFVNY